MSEEQDRAMQTIDRLIGGASVLSNDAKRSLPIYVKVEVADNEK